MISDKNNSSPGQHGLYSEKENTGSLLLMTEVTTVQITSLYKQTDTASSHSQNPKSQTALEMNSCDFLLATRLKYITAPL